MEGSKWGNVASRLTVGERALIFEQHFVTVVELPPTNIKSNSTPKSNPHPWNSNVNGIRVDQPAGTGFCKGRFVYINAWCIITTVLNEKNHLAVCGETSVVAPEDDLDADFVMPGARLMQHGLSDHNVANHRVVS